MQPVMREHQNGKQNQGSVLETILTTTDPRRVHSKEDLEDLTESDSECHCIGFQVIYKSRGDSSILVTATCRCHFFLCNDLCIRPEPPCGCCYLLVPLGQHFFFVYE